MTLIDILLWATAAIYPLLMLAEYLKPARWQPRLPLWRLRGALFFMLFAATSFYLPLVLPPAWFEAGLLPGDALGVAGGALVGYLATTLVGYAWHRSVHRVPLLWRAFHQMHHAPQRLDVSSAAIFHPSEMVFYTLMPLAVTTLVLGLDPLAASFVGLLATFNAVFQHANLATPRWLSWLMQRPEAHSIHHAEHNHNFSDFPLWDRLFGSYREPDGFRAQAGFGPLTATQWVAMALGRDLSAAAEPSPRLNRAG